MALIDFCSGGPSRLASWKRLPYTCCRTVASAARITLMVDSKVKSRGMSQDSCFLGTGGEELWLCRCSGSVIVYVVPCPGATATLMSPPWATAILFARARPSPAPPNLVACDSVSPRAESFQMCGTSSEEIPPPVSCTVMTEKARASSMPTVVLIEPDVVKCADVVRTLKSIVERDAQSPFTARFIALDFCEQLYATPSFISGRNLCVSPCTIGYRSTS
mmetsp:Transcript_29982/g.73815  ORF Transcript_29982/g.73815 Transcript_29982/m.73815 type:complete len:219 (-) Transcript_29982:981-1637(-)